MWICDFFHGRLTAGRIGPAESWSEHEASFVNECQTCMSGPRFYSDAGELLVFPSGDFILVTVSRLEHRFLESPAKSLIQNLPNRMAAQVLPQMFSDNLCYTFSSPVVILPTVCRCALRKQLFQKLQMAFIQFWVSPSAGNPNSSRGTLLKFLIQFSLPTKNAHTTYTGNE